MCFAVFWYNNFMAQSPQSSQKNLSSSPPDVQNQEVDSPSSYPILDPFDPVEPSSDVYSSSWRFERYEAEGLFKVKEGVFDADDVDNEERERYFSEGEGFIDSSKEFTPQRAFKTGYFELDNLYYEERENLAKDGMRLASYSFDEELQTHTLVCFNRVRFTKKEGERKVNIDFRPSPHEDLWEPVTTENAYLENSYNGYGYKANGFSPVMWPVLFSNASFLQHAPGVDYSKINDYHSRVVRQDPLFHVDENFLKKINQVRAVLDKINKQHNMRYRMKNIQSNVKSWWTHFVDRDVLKACIAVEGKTKGSRISWTSYALLTQQPDLDNILEHVKSMGVLASRLKIDHPHTWLESSKEEFLTPGWQKVWHEVEKLPVSVQKELSEKSHNDFYRHLGLLQQKERMLNQVNKEDAPFFKVFEVERVEENLSSIKLFEEVPALWSVFSNIKENIEQSSGKKLLPREQALIFSASYVLIEQACREKSFQDHPSETTNSATSASILPFGQERSVHLKKGLVENLALWLPDMIKGWKRKDPEGYRKWSKSDDYSWGHFALDTLKESVPRGRLAFACRDTQAFYEKEVLQKALEEKISEKSGKPSKSKKKKIPKIDDPQVVSKQRRM